MDARYYDPVIGRFYSNDPVGFTGDITTFNRYSYVGNNPYKYTDPTGKNRHLMGKRIAKKLEKIEAAMKKSQQLRKNKQKAKDAALKVLRPPKAKVKIVDSTGVLDKKPATTASTLDNKSADQRLYNNIKDQGDRPQDTPSPSQKTFKGKIAEIFRVVAKAIDKANE
ncbi:MAG: RHS repeat-associated core domain-containing protein [Psychrobium sp.]|nr:RHS repeat-associated core domain-containing protein [Psychrobium sp.]